MTVDFEGPSTEGVFLLRFNDGKDNRFNGPVFEKVFAALDIVEKHAGPTSLVITGNGKFFSNGFVLDYLMEYRSVALNNLHRLFTRLIELNVPSVCAINGHCYAGASMVALCCDRRVMNEEKGFFCANELDIGLPFTEAMTAVFAAKLTPSVRSRVMLGAERFSGKQALDAGIAEYIVPAHDVLPTAMNIAAAEATKGENKDIYKMVKQHLYAEALRRITKSIADTQASKL